MATNKQNVFRKLKIFYLAIFILGAAIILPTHLFPQPTFMYARFPHYLELMKPFLGFSWPATFEIYHYVLYILAVIVSFNALGIIAYPKFKKIAIASSLAGIFLSSSMILFLFLKFINVNISTAIIYGLYSLVLLIINILTFKAFILGQKEALDE